MGLGLLVGCALLPTLEPAEVRYVAATDWEGVPEVNGERVFETDLGYLVGLSAFGFRTTSLELFPCAFARFDPRPTRARAHGSYGHDESVVEADAFDDLMREQALARGAAPTSGSLYCELFSIHGTGRDELVTVIAGWYQAPGSEERIPLEAENYFGVSDLVELPLGDWDETLPPGAAEVRITRYPARSFDGLDLEALPPLDLVYEVSLELLRRQEARWTMGPAAN